MLHVILLLHELLLLHDQLLQLVTLDLELSEED